MDKNKIIQPCYNNKGDIYTMKNYFEDLDQEDNTPDSFYTGFHANTLKNSLPNLNLSEKDQKYIRDLNLNSITEENHLEIYNKIKKL